MTNVTDEVLSGEELFYIIPTTDQYGNTAYKIRLATNVETPGTPLNKLLFDSINADINEVVKTGSFTWNATSNTTVNLGYKPKFVIAISDNIHASASNYETRTVLLADNYGLMVEGGDNTAETSAFSNTFSSTGFTVKPLNTITSTFAIQNASATYIAFR